MMGQAVPEGKENNNTCPRVYTRRHISSYIKKVTMFRNVVVHMNGRSAYHTASAGGQVPSPMWVSSQLAAVRRQLHGSIARQKQSFISGGKASMGKHYIIRIYVYMHRDRVPYLWTVM